MYVVGTYSFPSEGSKHSIVIDQISCIKNAVKSVDKYLHSFSYTQLVTCTHDSWLVSLFRGNS